MDKAELQSKVEALRWFHTIDMGHGIVTKGVENSPERLVRIQLPSSLAGRSVLDIGAWDGFYSFEAERRQASRVWRPITTRGTAKGGAPGAARRASSWRGRALGSRVDDVDIDVMDLSPERVGSFDVVLFLGVLYHLRDPLLALERVSSVTKNRLILETAVDMVGIRRPAAAFYTGRELNDDPTNWWGPNQAAVEGMLQSVRFTRVELITPYKSAPFRAAHHHLKGKNRFASAFRQDRAVFHAFKNAT